MIRPTVATIVVVALVLLSSCSGFREIPKPWYAASSESELASSPTLHAGDRIRLTMSNSQAVEGEFVGADEVSITVNTGGGECPVVSIPIMGIEKLEVYHEGADTAIAVVGVVVVAYGVVHAANDKKEDSVLYSDGDASAKAQRRNGDI